MSQKKKQAYTEDKIKTLSSLEHIRLEPVCISGVPDQVLTMMTASISSLKKSSTTESMNLSWVTGSAST